MDSVPRLLYTFTTTVSPTVASIGGHGHLPLIPITCLEKPSGAAVTQSMLQLYVTVPARAIDVNERRKKNVITMLAMSKIET